jgi:hypothetical protein
VCLAQVVGHPQHAGHRRHAPPVAQAFRERRGVPL